MSRLVVELVVSPPLETNAYVVADPEAKRAVVIDPSFVGERMLELCRREEWQLDGIILTHGHIDHTHDAAELSERSGAPLLAHPLTEAALSDPVRSGALWLGMDLQRCQLARRLEEGQEVEIGGGRLRVLHTPGHSPGCICLLGEGICFTGDVLFRDGVGRWDFPDSDERALIESVRRLVRECDGETLLYPGHGPKTKMSRERRLNPFVRDWVEE